MAKYGAAGGILHNGFVTWKKKDTTVQTTSSKRRDKDHRIRRNELFSVRIL
jgi:hypothetical protein